MSSDPEMGRLEPDLGGSFSSKACTLLLLERIGQVLSLL